MFAGHLRERGDSQAGWLLARFSRHVTCLQPPTYSSIKIDRAEARKVSLIILIRSTNIDEHGHYGARCDLLHYWDDHKSHHVAHDSD